MNVTTFVTVAATFFCSAAFAGELYEPTDPYELLRRLQAAEQRIELLEQDKTLGDPDGVRQVDYSWPNATEQKQFDATKKPTWKINGRIHLDSWWFPRTSAGIDFFENPLTGDDPEDRIQFRRIRLEMGGDILDSMLYRIQLDFNNPQTPEYKDVYIGFKNLPGNQTILFGSQKRPIGLDHLNSSRYNVFLERPLVVEAFNEDARRIGAAVYGYTDDELYHWRYGVFSLQNTRSTGRFIGDSLQLSGNARLSSSPWYDESSGGRGYFHWAVAGMAARPDGDVGVNDTNVNEARFRAIPELRSGSRWINTNRIAGAEAYEILALESIFNVGPLQVTGEYQFNWVQRDGTTAGTGPDLYFHGAYIYLSYFLTGEHIPYNRKRATIGRVQPFQNFFLVCDRCGDKQVGWGAWAIAARYSYLDLTDQDILGGVEQNLTLALNWYWTAYSKLQFNAVYGDIENHAPTGGFTSGNFWGLGTRMAIEF